MSTIKWVFCFCIIIKIGCKIFSLIVHICNFYIVALFWTWFFSYCDISFINYKKHSVSILYVSCTCILCSCCNYVSTQLNVYNNKTCLCNNCDIITMFNYIACIFFIIKWYCGHCRFDITFPLGYNIGNLVSTKSV